MKQAHSLHIRNTTIITENAVYPNASLTTHNHTITHISPENDHHPADIIIDATDMTLTSGFIDLHVHGARNADTMDATPESLLTMARYFTTKGVTSFLPTTLTASHEQTLAALHNIRTTMTIDSTPIAQILGAHLEGPYLNPAKCGAQSTDHIRPIDQTEALQYLEVGVIRLLSLAPEYQEATWLIQECHRQGITTSIAHTNATYEQTHQAIQAGITHSTHTFNAMTGLNHREPGVIGAVMTHPQVRCELICDDIHVHPVAQKILWQAKGHDGIILITDAMRASGMPDGMYQLGNYDVTVQQGSARLADGTLAGSILDYDEGIRRFTCNLGLSFTDLWRTTSLNPARAIGFDQRKGSITIGKDADLVLLDAHLNVHTTIIMGEIAYTQEKNQ